MNESGKPSLTEALKTADLIHDRARVDGAIVAMGKRIDAELGAQTPGEVPVFLTVMNGGLLFAGALALAMRTDLEFDYLHATRYRSGTSGHELKWIKHPNVSLRGRIVLIADDILDEGHTIKAIRDHCVAEGVRRVYVAVLCEKRHGRTVPGIQADFVGLEVPDRYVFGYGMDFFEQGRNLPGIFALKDSA